MTIKTITVARLINTGNYENTRFELSAELADGDDLWQAGEALQVALVELAVRERDRRYPDPAQRPWHLWVEEDERAQALADAEARAVRAGMPPLDAAPEAP